MTTASLSPLGEDEIEGAISIEADPRRAYSVTNAAQKLSVALTLRDLETQHAEAVNQILRAKDDIKTLKRLADIASADADEAEKSGYSAFIDQLKKAEQALDQIEKEWREPPQTVGRFKRDDVAFHIGTAQWFVNTAADTPTPTNLDYVSIAERKAARAADMHSALFSGEIAALREKAQKLGLVLLAQGTP